MSIEVEDVFPLSGPKHLTAVDWKNADHKRCVAASLVKGVYILERDRQKKRKGTQNAHAPKWWQFFHFQLIHQMTDVDYSTFGAIFEFKPESPSCMLSIEYAPKYVIAFRGTMIKRKSFLQDLKLDFAIIKNGLDETSRFKIAMEAVKLFLGPLSGVSNVWLTGHSLGAAIAMLIGKNMAKTKVFLDAYLFNPPFPSLPIEKIRDKKLRDGIHIASAHIKAALNLVVNGAEHQKTLIKDPHFATLSTWMPSLFVNQEDAICAEYIGYFENKVNMKEIGASVTERLGSSISVKGTLLNKDGHKMESFHRLPSAHLVVNGSSSADLESSHGIHQWWGPELCLKSILYTN